MIIVNKKSIDYNESNIWNCLFLNKFVIVKDNFYIACDFIHLTDSFLSFLFVKVWKSPIAINTSIQM